MIILSSKKKKRDRRWEREAICYNKVFMIDRRWGRDAICYNKVFMIHGLMSCVICGYILVFDIGGD